ncbi:hypothetical protein IE53DRAFT_73098 [Violaceomyces palustris]|uniref:Uncharacterized protein n=1 Tax=Violaceomyces palustris TaxID=1673888 RepID=A0ACD0NYU3_9BASI|nr:hypothetical protein IE53DRAFT_73098 [Violaceomyces palustris]
MSSSPSKPNISRPPLRSKFSECYTSLLSGDHPWLKTDNQVPSFSQDDRSNPRPGFNRSKSSAKSNSAPRARFFADLLCLPVETHLVCQLIASIPPDTLLDDDPSSTGASIRENIGSLWRESVRVWREEDEDEVRRANAIETLVALSYSILIKRFSNYSFDIITIFAGGMDEADEVFTSLVVAIDDTLRGSSKRWPILPSSTTAGFGQDEGQPQNSQPLDTATQHRVLQLALLWLACVSQTSLGAYFLRRDLFNTISTFISSPSTSPFAYEAALFIGLLAMVGQGSSSGMVLGTSTSNPYARRLRDWVDEGCMTKVILSSAAALEQAVARYVEVSDDAPPSVAGAIAGLASLKWMSGLGQIVGFNTLPISGSGVAESPANGPRGAGTISGGDFSHLPPPSAVILLSVFLFSRSNPAFTNLVMRIPAQNDDVETRSDQPSPPGSGLALYVHLLSISSYLSAHASSNYRSRSFSRIALILMLLLLFDPQGARTVISDHKACQEAVTNVRICRQREPPLSLPSRKRIRLITANLDVATMFLRYNLSKRMDVASYMVALRIIQKTIVLCSDEMVRVEYEWDDTWSSIFGLAGFLAIRHAEMRISSDVGELIRALISTLNTALIRSDKYLATTNETHLFIYELVRSSSTLRRLISILAGENVKGAVNGSGGNNNGSVTSTPPLTGVSSPPPTFSNSFGGPAIPTHPKIYSSLPEWKNVEKVIVTVESRIEEWVSAKSSRRNKTPDVGAVMKMIAGLDLENLLIGGDNDGKPSNGVGGNASWMNGGAADHHELDWLDRVQENSLPEFVRYACLDILQILPIY